VDRFIVRVSEEKFLFFYYEKGNIFVREMLYGEVSEIKTTINNVRENYTVNLCKNGDIYIFCQTISGDILHIKYNNGKYDKNVMLKSTGKNTYNIIFNSIENGSDMSLIYNVPISGKNSFDIMKQSFDGNKSWNPPEKIDTAIFLNNFIFKVSTIDFGYGIVFYQKSERGCKYNIGYREISTNGIGKFNSVYSTNYRITAESFLILNNSIHFIFTVKNIFSSRIIYRKKGMSNMDDYIVLGESQQVESCELFFANKKLYAFWKNTFDIFYCISEDNGNTFSKPYKYTKKNSANLKKAIYLSFPKMSTDKFFINNLYTAKDKIWDIQILPHFYENFITKKDNSHTEIEATSNNTYKNNAISSENNIIAKLKNQINMLNSQIAFKDKQIEQLMSSIQRKNEEIILNDRKWRNKYRVAYENMNKKDEVKKEEPKKEDIKKEDIKKEEPKKEDIKKENIEKENIEKENIEKENKEETLETNETSKETPI